MTQQNVNQPPGGNGGKSAGPGAQGRLKLTPKPQIGQLLVQADVITLEQFEKAKTRGGDIMDALFALGYLDSPTFVDFLVNYPGIAPTDLIHFEIRRDLIGLITPELANRHQVIPIDRRGDVVVLGCARALAAGTVKAIEETLGRSVMPVLCTVEDVQAAVLRYYPLEEPAETSLKAQVEGLHEPMRLSQVADLIRQIDTLPALPETVAQVRDAMQNPNSSVNSVVDVITLDPPIAAKVLSVANSSAYGFSHKIHDLTLAVSLLGLRETYAIVLSSAIVDLLNKFRHFNYRAFFLEAISCATASRIVARASGRRNLVGVFSAGLLHDIGRAALWETVPGLSAKIDPHVSGMALISAEERVIGLNHAEAGYLLATHWDLPEEIACAIRFHHAPEKADTVAEHVAIVALADAMVRVSGTKLHDNPSVFKGLEGAMQLLGIDGETAEAMLDEFLTRYEAALNDAFG